MEQTYPKPTAKEIAAWHALDSDSAEAWAKRLNGEIERTGTTPRAQLAEFEARYKAAPNQGPAYVIGEHAHIAGEVAFAGVPLTDWRTGDDEISVSWLHRMRLRAEPEGRWEVQPFDNGYDYI